MTEGGAFSFVIRLLLGGALISGLLLYAAQSLQKGPAPAKDVPAEKIGPTLSSRQSAPPKPAPIVQSAPVPAPSAAIEPAAQPVSAPPGASALMPAPGPATGTGRVTSSYGTDPAPAPVPAPAPATTVPQATTAQVDTFGVVADESTGDAKPAAGAARPSRAKSGQAGCQHYKSYNAATQTYRSFDGKIRDCKP